MSIFNITRQTVLARTAEKADTVFSRLRGLIGRDSLPDGHAMMITQCRSIHMLFMRFPIDAVFADRNGRVVGLVERIKPFQMSPYFFRASYVVELPPGTIQATGTVRGDLLQIRE